MIFTVNLRSSLSVCAMLTVMGCTQPNITTELAAVGTLLESTDDALRPGLVATAKKEHLAAQNAVIANGGTPLVLDGSCQIVMPALNAPAEDDCVLTSELGKIPSPNAAEMIKALDFANAYFTAIDALAASTAPADIRTNAAALVASMTAQSEVENAAFIRVAERLKERPDALPETLGFLAKQHQINALRRVVRQAEPVFADLMKGAENYYVVTDEALLSAFEDLTDASDEVFDASDSGDAKRGRTARDNLQTKYDEFVAIRAASPAAKFASLRRLHSVLLKKLNGTASLDEVIGVLVEIEVVMTALEKETEQ